MHDENPFWDALDTFLYAIVIGVAIVGMLYSLALPFLFAGGARAALQP